MTTESCWTHGGAKLFSTMQATAPDNLASLIAAEVVALPVEKQSSVLDYVRFMRHQAGVSEEDVNDGDAAWDRLLSDPQKTARFAAWSEEALKEGPAEPLDLSRL